MFNHDNFCTIHIHLWSTDLSAFIFDRQTYLHSALIDRLICIQLWSTDLSAFSFVRQTYLHSSLIDRLICVHLWSTDLSAFISDRQTYLHSSLIDRLICIHLWSTDLSPFSFDRQTYPQSFLIDDLSIVIFDRQTYPYLSLIDRLIYSHLSLTDLSAFIFYRHTYLHLSFIDTHIHYPKSSLIDRQRFNRTCNNFKKENKNHYVIHNLTNFFTDVSLRPWEAVNMTADLGVSCPGEAELTARITPKRLAYQYTEEEEVGTPGKKVKLDSTYCSQQTSAWMSHR